MHMAAQGGNVSVLNVLLSQGADLMALNNEKDTPLHIAVRHRHGEFCKQLIKLLKKARTKLHGADLENTRENMTPYFIAVLNGLFDIAKELVKEGLCNPDKVNSDGKTIKDLA